MKFVEASFTIPILVLVVVILISFSMTLFINFNDIVDTHINELNEIYSVKGSFVIRSYEAFS